MCNVLTCPKVSWGMNHQSSLEMCQCLSKFLNGTTFFLWWDPRKLQVYVLEEWLQCVTGSCKSVVLASMSRLSSVTEGTEDKV